MRSDTGDDGDRKAPAIYASALQALVEALGTATMAARLRRLRLHLPRRLPEPLSSRRGA